MSPAQNTTCTQIQPRPAMDGCGVRWSVGENVAYPLDEVPDAYAAYGLIPLSASATNAVQLRKVSGGTTADFGFAGGELDQASIDAWKGAEPAYPTRAATIAKLYDQTGNGRDAEQATTGNQPGYQVVSNVPVADLAGPNIFGASGFLNLPNWSGSARDYTSVFLFRSNDRTFGTGTEAAGHFPVSGHNTSVGGYAGFSAGSNPTFKQMVRSWRGGSFDDHFMRGSNLGYQTLVLRANGTDTKIILNGQIISTIGASVTATLSSGAIGRLGTAGILAGSCHLVAALYYPALSDGDLTKVTDALLEGVGASAWTHNVFFDGDSITGGYDSTQGGFDVRHKSWPYEALQSLNRPHVRGCNVAISAQTLTTLTAHASLKVDQNYSASLFGTNNILYIFAGTNDIVVDSDSAATILSQLQTYVAARKAAGWNKVIVITPIPRQVSGGWTSGMSVILSDYRDLIIANAGDFDGVIDVGWTTEWTPGASWTVNYQDGIHPNAAGRAIISAAVLPSLQSLT
jgi:lysophospholipase L1-like esterase